jgi:hypothetical protein
MSFGNVRPVCLRRFPIFERKRGCAKGIRVLCGLREIANRYAMFLSIAGELQTLVGEEQPILLPTRKIAEILNCDQRTVSRLRKFAVADGLLEIVKPHRERSEGRITATEFEFALKAIPYIGRGEFYE